MKRIESNLIVIALIFAVYCSYSQCPVSGDILVTEIMYNPATASDSDGEWFEIHNLSESPVDLMGWEISDQGQDVHVIDSQLVIEPMAYAVLGRNGDNTVNGGVISDYAYSGFILSNSEDEIILKCGGAFIDQVVFNTSDGFPSVSGASIQLDTAFLTAQGNNDGANWCASTTVFGDGDLGTPGENNLSCEIVSSTKNLLPLSLKGYLTGSILHIQSDDYMDNAHISIMDINGRTLFNQILAIKKSHQEIIIPTQMTKNDLVILSIVYNGTRFSQILVNGR